jgi:hypothetical protein
MSSNHPVVDMLKQKGLYCSVLFSLYILQVIGVNNSNHMLKLVCPTISMVIPRQMLRFLQDSHISFSTWNEL